MKHTVTITIKDTTEGSVKVNIEIDLPAGKANSAALQCAADFLESIAKSADRVRSSKE